MGMLQRDLFTKTLREDPKDEESLNARYLIRAGFIDKLMAGVYNFLPLGLRVLKKIERIVREEIDAIGARELLMPALHPLENYIKTGRDKIDILFHTQAVGGQKMVLGQSHEEIVVPLAKKFIQSYRDLPVAAYQIQTKFRNELRVKSGIFRGREFGMKDLYSFHASDEDFKAYYDRVQQAYKKIFDRVGIGKKTYFTYASGGTFSEYSHEFQTLTAAGEDTIYICMRCNTAVNDEIIGKLGKACPHCKSGDFSVEKSIEVANIFPLGTRFSDAFELTYSDPEGMARSIIMGCYGIGISRLMGAIAELYNDERGLSWPLEVAPFKVHLISLHPDRDHAEKIYQKLNAKHVEVLFDDREDKTAGEKFADADLIGIPWRIVVSEKTVSNDKVEVKKRSEEEGTLMDIESFIKIL